MHTTVVCTKTAAGVLAHKDSNSGSAAGHRQQGGSRGPGERPCGRCGRSQGQAGELAPRPSCLAIVAWFVVLGWVRVLQHGRWEWSSGDGANSA